MEIDKKVVWFFLLLTTIVFSYSCQSSDQKTQSAIIQIDESEPKIDTSFWLRETRGIRDILEDKEGNLWYSSPDYIAMYNGENIKYFSEDEGLEIVGNIHEDQNGTIWIEDGFKIYRYDGERFLAGKLDASSALNTMQAEQYSLWVQKGLSLTDTSYVELGIYNFNNANTHFFSLPVKKTANNKYLYFPTSKAIMSKDSTVWFATMEKVFGFKKNSFISIGREEMGRENDPRQMGIRGIYLDSNNKLWIADNGAGVFVYDGTQVENFTKQHHLDEKDTKGSTLHRAFSIAEDSTGNMWFGTVYSGVWKYNPNTNEFKNYTKDHGVYSENIWTIYRTREGELLFAGESPAAVYTFNGKAFDRKY